MRRAWIILLLVGVIALIGCTVIRRSVSSLVYDNREHGLSCEKLPLYSEVQESITAHADTVQQIIDINPNGIFVEVDGDSCPDRADIVIHFNGHEERERVEELLGDTFFGVPYRMYNH